MKLLASPRRGGFTLVELLVVIAILAILASIALPAYVKYRTRAVVTSYALPILRACMADIATYCSTHGVAEIYNPVGDSRFPNCKANTTTAGGTVVIETITNPQCNHEGVLIAGAIRAYISGSESSYVAKCEVTVKPFRCYIE